MRKKLGPALTVYERKKKNMKLFRLRNNSQICPVLNTKKKSCTNVWRYHHRMLLSTLHQYVYSFNVLLLSSLSLHSVIVHFNVFFIRSFWKMFITSLYICKTLHNYFIRENSEWTYHSAQFYNSFIFYIFNIIAKYLEYVNTFD